MRYLLFAGSVYYPDGGWNDFIAAYERYEDAVGEGNRLKRSDKVDWWHVVDLTTRQVVA